MLSAIRTRCTYANVVATFALVFAMSGGALAASHYLVTSTKQISPKVLKSLHGANGATGANGASGATGPAGGAGPQGPAGPRGENGSPGTPGANGESVTNTTLKPGATCEKGGAEFKAGSGAATHACNGKEGSPWTAGGTLPHGSSETGVWSFNLFRMGDVFYIPISFPISLAASLDAAHVHLIDFEEPSPEGCPGSEQKPEAEPGNLCIWGHVAGVEVLRAAIFARSMETHQVGAGKNGTVLEGTNPIEAGYGRGEWVVSGP